MAGMAPTTATTATDLPPSLILLRGDEQLLVDRAILRVVSAARRVNPETERRDAAAAGMAVGEFSDLVAPSLFAEPRVVVLRGAQESTKDFAAGVFRYIAEPVDGVILVVHHSGAARNRPLADGIAKAGAAVITCAAITRTADRIEFVRREIRAASGTTTPAAVAALVDAVGTDLAELASAASQLVADTGGMVDEKAVHRYYRGRADVSGFAVADLAVAGNIPGALEALRWALIVGEPAVRIADALAGGVRTIAKVAGSPGGSAQQLAAQLGMPPWKIDKARGPAKAWSAAGLTMAMTTVARLNADVKGGAADAEYALERAVLDIGRARRMARP
ncbi:MAG: DNA polymerase III subunit delta [Nakamurella sp.]